MVRQLIDATDREDEERNCPMRTCRAAAVTSHQTVDLATLNALELLDDQAVMPGELETSMHQVGEGRQVIAREADRRLGRSTVQVFTAHGLNQPSSSRSRCFCVFRVCFRASREEKRCWLCELGKTQQT